MSVLSTLDGGLLAALTATVWTVLLVRADAVINEASIRLGRPRPPGQRRRRPALRLSIREVGRMRLGSAPKRSPQVHNSL